MKDWRSALIGPESTVRTAVNVIDAAGLQIALVVDEDHRLLGTVTDGDIRRGILQNVSLDDPVTRVMNGNPTTAREYDDREMLLGLMRQRLLHQIPVLDASWRVVGLEVLDDLLAPTPRTNPVVLMAGGLGTRLRPLTHDRPKPLLHVGPKPILETILERFVDSGFRRFSIAVNYMADMIEGYFEDGSRWGVEITYIRETERLGTAGALALLPESPTEPLLVMNADLVTQLNFIHLLDFHHMHQAAATMCVRDYEIQVPYGVVESQDHRILAIREKPIQRFLVNAGVYVLEPETLSLVPTGRAFDMPDLFRVLMEQHYETAVFPVRENWADIGHADDLERANGQFDQSQQA